MPIFCRHQDFVDVEILSTPIICRCWVFVDANILWTPRFCQRQYFLMPRFFQRRDFVDAEILLTPRFCWRLTFVKNSKSKECIAFSHFFNYFFWLFYIFPVLMKICLLWLCFVYIIIIINLSKPFSFLPLDTCWSLLRSQKRLNTTTLVLCILALGFGKC
jgi:hypothetical protein